MSLVPLRDYIVSRAKKKCYFRARIEMHKAQIVNLRSRATSISTNWNSPRVRNSGSAHGKAEDAVTRIADIENLIAGLQAEFDAENELIKAALQMIDDPIARVIAEMRYLEDMVWDEIAECVPARPGRSFGPDAAKKRMYRGMKNLRIDDPDVEHFFYN